MVFITEELVRKRAEHNEGEIFSLEELSLHQENLEKLEHIDKWCRDLKILYLQNNLIPKIENLGRLKKLEYVNFTLNNITKIENLEVLDIINSLYLLKLEITTLEHRTNCCKGCESLKKLDLTVNFIGELTSIHNLRNNFNLEDLYLTGNPCTDFEGYREYVIVTLPQLTRLDGVEITKSERILAMQRYNRISREILQQERTYLKKQEKILGTTRNSQQEDEACGSKDENNEEEKEKRFWSELTQFTPQTRIETYKHLEKAKKKPSEIGNKSPKPPRKFVLEDGRVLNCNEPKLDFVFVEEKEDNSFHLDLATYKYLDTSLIDVDVQPTYVRATVKGKVFQMVLPEEVHPDRSAVRRSQTTGHLQVIMPKVKSVIRKKKQEVPHVWKKGKDESDHKLNDMGNAKLEVTPTLASSLHQIIDDEKKKHEEWEPSNCQHSSPFEDNPEVPPLI